MGLECRVATRLEPSRTTYPYILRFYGKSNAALCCNIEFGGYWVDDDHDEHEVGLKEKPEYTRYIKKITSK